MRDILSSLRARLPRIVAVLVLAAAGPAFADEIVFDPISGAVTIPSVKVGSATYVNVTLGKTDGFNFALQGASAGSVAGAPLATYDIPTNVLLLPAVRLGSQTYKVQLLNVGGFNFNLMSAALVETYTFYSRARPGVAQTATLSNGTLIMDGIAISNFSFGQSGEDNSGLLPTSATPWNSLNQPTVPAMLWCGIDGNLSYVIVEDTAKATTRTTATAANLVDAIHAAPPANGMGLYRDCSGSPAVEWRNNLPADNFRYTGNLSTTFTSAVLLGQLDGAVMFRALGTTTNQHNYLGITWKGVVPFEVWQ
ncbi:MAG: hypothetical protein V4787_06685 [Pseudomonadota bacterium]